MPTQILNIPVVFYNLRQQETYLQIFDSLEILNQTCEEIFKRISNKIIKEKNRLQQVSIRLTNAQTKIQQITGTNKATTIFSPSKFPSPEYISEYNPLYLDSEKKVSIKHSNYKLQDIPHLPPNNLIDPLIDIILFKEISVSDIDISKHEGLGRLPSNLPSISSLLLFNTSENPYKKYMTLDNLAGKESEIKIEDVKIKKKELSEAPKTFTEGDTLPSVATIDYGYKPKLGEVPELHLPSVLPNLPNIADINWSANQIQSIAPSLLTEISLPAVEISETTIQNNSEISIEPPPPPPPLSSIIISTDSQVNPPPPPDLPPPPPGPPPPTFSSSSNQSPPPPPPPSDIANLPPIDSARMDLLAQIRQGTKLKPASKRKLKEKKKEKSNSTKPTPTGDIFSDLIQALNIRRRGIAEKQKEIASQDENDEITVPSEANEWET